jgi:hypothetical protein
MRNLALLDPGKPEQWAWCCHQMYHSSSIFACLGSKIDNFTPAALSTGGPTPRSGRPLHAASSFCRPAAVPPVPLSAACAPAPAVTLVNFTLPLELVQIQFLLLSHHVLPEEARCVCRQAAGKGGPNPILLGAARSKQDPLFRGHGARYFHRPPPAGADKYHQW